MIRDQSKQSDQCGQCEQNPCTCVHFYVYYADYCIDTREVLSGYCSVKDEFDPDPEDYEYASFNEDGFNIIHADSLVSEDEALRIAIDYAVYMRDNFADGVNQLSKRRLENGGSGRSSGSE